MTILDRLPPLLQNERARDQMDTVFDEDQLVYTLPKAPVTRVHGVTGFVDGVEVTFTEGDDYTLNTNNDGDYIEIDWNGSGEEPDDGTTFTVDATYNSIISRYTAAHDEEMDTLDVGMEEVSKSHEIDNASGEELDRIGAIFGELGERRGRADSDYRIYLKSVVRSFNGRGSLSGLKFAIASSIGGTEDNVNIIEDFENLEYTIELTDVDTGFISVAVNDLAELADPSVVVLNEAIILLSDGSIALTSSEVTRGDEYSGLGGDTLTLDGASNLG